MDLLNELCKDVLLDETKMEFLKLYNSIRGKITVQILTLDNFEELIESLKLSRKKRKEIEKLDQCGLITDEGWFSSIYMQIIRINDKYIVGYFLLDNFSLHYYLYNRPTYQKLSLDDDMIWKVMSSTTQSILGIYYERNSLFISTECLKLQRLFVPFTDLNKGIFSCIGLRILETASMNKEYFSLG